MEIEAQEEPCLAMVPALALDEDASEAVGPVEVDDTVALLALAEDVEIESYKVNILVLHSYLGQRRQ